MARLIDQAEPAAWTPLAALVELGLNHEQQHQELILMDIKHLFSLNPLAPAYAEAAPALSSEAAPATWLPHAGGLVEIGCDGQGFAFDNEGPRHRVWLEPFAIASRLSTVGEYQAFIDDGGYRRPDLWLSEGWAAVQREGWTAPLYWRDETALFTLYGERPCDPAEPVSHLSFFEAEAFARWSGRRLPTEAEWETAADAAKPVSSPPAPAFHPAAALPASGLQQMTGELWQWTASPYGPYPRYRPPAGAIGEYNGKFMSGQMVLRGGSVATPAGHARPTYRNFFPPAARWAFSGVRLADDV